MTTRYDQAIIAGLLACGLSAFVPAIARAQDNPVLPLEKNPQATLTGCFVRETVGNHERYILANPIVGSVASVPNGNCTASGQLVKLERIKKRTLDTINVGTYVEVNGKLEKAHGDYEQDFPRHLREFEVQDAREVPVVPPRVAEAAPAPTPYMPPAPTIVTPPAPIPEAPAPTGTTGVKAKKHKMPHTASQQPLTGLMALLTLTGGLILRLRRQQFV